ncbi:hypothetical protein L7F22_021287 [Adiantum nelumboides]|nr:hypothetical protein [Adiantum nelumboides]
MEAKKPKAGPLDIPSGVARGPTNGQKGDLYASNRNFKTGVSSLDSMQESSGRVSHHVRSFSYERNKVANVPGGISKEGTKGGENVEAQGQGSINQNGGLYIGGGKMVGPSGSPYGTMSTSTAANGKADKVELSPHVVHVRSNSAGCIKTGKSFGNAHWASGTGSGFEGASNAGGRPAGGSKGDIASETLSNGGSSNGGSPSQDLVKGLKAKPQVEEAYLPQKILGNLAFQIVEMEQQIGAFPPLVILGNLRLGLVESSKQHFQSAGQQISAQDLQQGEQVKMQISKCIEMRKVANWKLVIRESDAAVIAGADSAPQVMGYQAEALLKLRKLDEADTVLSAAQRIDKALTKLGITPADSFLYVLRAHLDMALGRFEEAVAAAQSAVRVDPRRAEALEILRKARAVHVARSSGNELFKLGKFFEACAAYGEGLESDPYNAVLLCNRAACRSKIGQWEKAVEDCNAALEVQPNYTKAVLRRADCSLKLERWEDTLNDYESLLKELPGDRDVARGIFEAQSALNRSKEEMFKKKPVEEVSDKDQFREAVTFPGLVVVQFIARWNDRCREILPFTELLCKRYPAVNFIKVDVEENPYLAKTESVNSVPTFKLYRNGTKMKEMLGPSQQALENAVQQFSL